MHQRFGGLFARLYEDVLWCDKAMRYNMPKPVRYVKDVIVLHFLVHGCHDIVDVHGDGRVVVLGASIGGSCPWCLH